ncbi:hypothetical protein GWI33_015042, partial [Rhynchophorus ferrugineus]
RHGGVLTNFVPISDNSKKTEVFYQFTLNYSYMVIGGTSEYRAVPVRPSGPAAMARRPCLVLPV